MSSEDVQKPLDSEKPVATETPSEPTESTKVDAKPVRRNKKKEEAKVRVERLCCKTAGRSHYEQLHAYKLYMIDPLQKRAFI